METCTKCGKFLVWQNEGEDSWFCWYCDPTNNTSWRFSNAQSNYTQITPANDFQNRVLGCLFGLAIGESIGKNPSNSSDPMIGVILAQLITSLRALIATIDDTSGLQEEFCRRLGSSRNCILSQKVIRHQLFAVNPESSALAVHEEYSKGHLQNTALSRAIAAGNVFLISSRQFSLHLIQFVRTYTLIGIFFSSEPDVAAEAAKVLTSVTHHDAQGHYAATATTCSALIAILLNNEKDPHSAANGSTS